MKLNKWNVRVLIVSFFEQSNDLSMLDNIRRNTRSRAACFWKLLAVESIWQWQQNLKLIAHWKLISSSIFPILRILFCWQNCIWKLTCPVMCFWQGNARAELLHHLSITLAIIDSEIKLRKRRFEQNPPFQKYRPMLEN